MEPTLQMNNSYLLNESKGCKKLAESDFSGLLDACQAVSVQERVNLSVLGFDKVYTLKPYDGGW